MIRRLASHIRVSLAALLLLCGTAACEQADETRIPYAHVRIDLTFESSWSMYGVTGLGEYRIFRRDKRQPANFSYTANTYTGFGGVLLIGAGVGEVVPMAYDLACPVERSTSTTIEIDKNNLDAVCPNCGSRFNVLVGNGMAISGPAHDKNYRLRHYKCVKSQYNGYLIVN